MVALALSALLVSAAFEPIGVWFLAVLGYSLFLRSLRTTHFPIFGSFIFGLLVNAVVLHWSSKYVGALPWLLLSLLQSIFYLPVGWVFRKTRSLRWTLFALLISEELRARYPFGGFSWTRIAFSQSDSPLAPLLSYGGVLLLSFATLILALLLTRINVQSCAVVSLLIIFVVLLPNNPSTKEEISLIAIQGNTPSVGIGFTSRAKAVFNLHRDATMEFVQKKYDAIIWPENAIDIDPRNYPGVERDIKRIVRKLDTPLIAGVVLTENAEPQNASILYGVNGASRSTYIKRYLTPFGEYIPLRRFAEFFSPYASLVNDFQEGKELVTHKIGSHRVAPIICYEIINDGLVREASSKSGALIVQTNSATFANTAESAQQLAITRVRAIEHSREILSISTIGISAFIDNNGAVKKQIPENISAAIAGELSISKHRTIADRLGGVAPLLTLFASFLLALTRIKRVSLG